VHASSYDIRSDNVADFFAVPIYHWKAPFEKPRPLEDASFFVDGVTLGRGRSGFQALMENIEASSGPVFILAPRIKNEGQASPSIAEGQLTDWAAAAAMTQRFEKIYFSRYGGLMDLARFMDE
jgi:hypothetical protein